MRRTPTCALHVHVGMPDPRRAIRAFNGLRAYLPVLQGLAAHSPVLARRWTPASPPPALSCSARFPRAMIPPAFAGWEDYVAYVDAWLAARRRARLHVPVVGPAAAPEARHDRAAGDGRAGAPGLGRRPGGARPRSRRSRCSTAAPTRRSPGRSSSRARSARAATGSRRPCAGAVPCARCGSSPPRRSRWPPPRCASAAATARSRRPSGSCARATAPTGCAPRTPQGGMRAVLERLVAEAAQAACLRRLRRPARERHRDRQHRDRDARPSARSPAAAPSSA